MKTALICAEWLQSVNQTQQPRQGLESLCSHHQSPQGRAQSEATGPSVESRCRHAAVGKVGEAEPVPIQILQTLSPECSTAAGLIGLPLPRSDPVILPFLVASVLVTAVGCWTHLPAPGSRHSGRCLPAHPCCHNGRIPHFPSSV